MFIECTLYGVFLILFITSTSLLIVRWRTLKDESRAVVEKKRRLSLLLYISVGIMMFICLSGVWAFSWIRLLKPDLVDPAGSSFGLYAGLAVSEGQPLTPAIFGRGIFFVATSKASDLILTYRLWIIFNKSLRVMVFPYLIWTGYFVTCVSLTANYIMFEKISRVWMLFFIGLSICLNIYITGSVLFKVRRAQRFTSYGGSDVIKPMAIIIESAAIYTIWLFVFVITSVIPHASAVSEVLSEGIAPVAGIVTVLVNVRVGLGWAWDRSLGRPESPDATGNDIERWYTECTLTTDSAPRRDGAR
ncbi:hypothetical protein P691DRAFT_767084 [Macrolepiota fuliginosa MF-IS2]|uniref:Uncharacterized protein n=1 Tax=Macrolepiota fuliginosa MF-IS2 TaxID=1400762 RepID=A0A9P5WZP6_9AGAR|nr:hypothetical protein P691DRAFT_767084 [Macrolepiota fuliginosa MF-IS2]